MEEIPDWARIVSKVLVEIVRAPKDLPVCKTRIIRGGRGFLINRRLAIHPLPDGTLHITPIP